MLDRIILLIKYLLGIKLDKIIILLGIKENKSSQAAEKDKLNCTYEYN